MKLDFTLQPYTGANPVTFEMEFSDVARVLGPPDAVYQNDLNEREERRGPVSVRYAEGDGKVSEIAFNPLASLRFQDENLFEHPYLIQFLLRFDPKPFEWVGFLIFQEIGITVTGFQDRDGSQKAITVFRRGRLDEFQREFMAYSP